MRENGVTPQDEALMALALDLAGLAVTRGQMPFGAVVTGADGEILGEGHNLIRSELDPSAHGEIVAIREACRRLGTWRLTGCTLYTSCEPCLLCSFVIVKSRIRRIVFAARGRDVPRYRPLLDADLTEVAAWVNAQSGWPPIVVIGDVMRERARETLAAFSWGEPG
jgi:tRNA(adenine34) deaminase